MALCQISFFGSSIGLTSSMNVLLPEQGQGPFPVFYLLHGLSDDHSMWLRRTSIERYVEGLPLIVVMPATHRGWYVNAATPPGLKYEDHILQDVLGFVERTFPVIPERRGRAIGGLSMGGYGAVKLALKHPHLFCSANSHSGALLGPFSREGKKVEEWRKPMMTEFDAIFGPHAITGDDNPEVLAPKCPKDIRPALRLDCGTDDFLLPDNRAFHAHLESIGYPHEYQEFPGCHSWDYWDLHIREALAFHRKNLGI